MQYNFKLYQQRITLERRRIKCVYDCCWGRVAQICSDDYSDAQLSLRADSGKRAWSSEDSGTARLLN